MTDIVVVQQRFRAKVRLAVRLKMPFSAAGKPVLIGVDPVRRLPGDHVRHAPQSIRPEPVVVIAQNNILSPGQSDGTVGVSGDTEIFPGMNDSETGFVPGSGIEGGNRFRVCAAAVIKDGFPVQQGLGTQRLQQSVEHSRICIVNRDSHTDQSGSWLVFVLTAEFLFTRVFFPPLPLPGAEKQLSGLLPKPADSIGHPVLLPKRGQPAEHSHTFPPKALLHLMINSSARFVKSFLCLDFSRICGYTFL